jgi:hypothetical protein
MSHFHLSRLRTSRPEYPSYSYSLFPPSLTRRDSNKRNRSITLSDDDDGHDDYPYSANHKPVRVSRALTVHKPILREPSSQLERYNIWSDSRRSLDEEKRPSYDSTRRVYRYSEIDGRVHSDNEDEEEREFRVKVNATFGRPNSPHPRRLSVSPVPSSRHTTTHLDVFRPKDTWVDEQWVTRERSRSISRERSRTRRDSFWADRPLMIEEKERESEEEAWRSYSRVKRTKTDFDSEEWRPLSAWRRRRLVMEG